MTTRDTEAERALICCCLLDAEAAHAAVRELEPAAFTVTAHRRAFEGIRAVLREGGDPDVITVGSALGDHGGFEAVNQILGSQTKASNWSAHIERLGHLQLVRQVDHAAAELHRQVGGCSNRDAVRELVEGSLGPLLAAGRRRRPESLLDAAAALHERLEAQSQGVEEGAGVPCGLDFFDEQGGLPRGEITVIGARPSHGKSALALHAALTAARQDFRVLLLSLEMPVLSVVSRAAASTSGVALGQLKNGRRLRAEDWQRLGGAFSELGDLPMRVWDDPTVSIADLRAQLALERSLGRPVDLVVVDYLQLVRATEQRRGMNREQEVAQLSKGLKAMAMQEGCAVIVAAQLSREIERRSDPRPMLSDLRESGQVEADAHVVMGLVYPHKADPSKPDDELKVYVLKNRDGRCTKFSLHYDPKIQRISTPEGWAA